MTAATHSAAAVARDLEATLASRRLLLANANLRRWYERLYRSVLPSGAWLGTDRVLEIGSGAAPLREFLPTCITSDVLPLDYVDHVFDCHEIDRYEGIPDASVDTILLVNVLHHLNDPVTFLVRASAKLAPAGEMVLVEPYFSALSTPIFRWLHHEPVDFGIEAPLLERVDGPLSSSNQALPYLIFFRRPEWRAALAAHYDAGRTRIGFFSGLSYFASGGISRRLPIPAPLYRLLMAVDLPLARALPRLWAAFFVARLPKRD